MRVSWNRDAVVTTLEQWEHENVTGLTAGDVTFEGTNVVPVAPTTGTTVDAAAAIAPLEAELASGRRAPVALPTKPVPPVLSDADVQRVADQATAVLERAVRDRAGRRHDPLTPEQVAAALITTRQPDGRGLALAIDPARLATAAGAAGARSRRRPSMRDSPCKAMVRSRSCRRRTGSRSTSPRWDRPSLPANAASRHPSRRSRRPARRSGRRRWASRNRCRRSRRSTRAARRG